MFVFVSSMFTNKLDQHIVERKTHLFLGNSVDTALHETTEVWFGLKQDYGVAMCHFGDVPSIGCCVLLRLLCRHLQAAHDLLLL